MSKKYRMECVCVFTTLRDKLLEYDIGLFSWYCLVEHFSSIVIKTSPVPASNVYHMG